MKVGYTMLRLLLILLCTMMAAPSAGAKVNPWEVSFGTTQMFSGWYSKEPSNLPTSSATLILSREIFGNLSVWGIFNLPLVPNQEVTSSGELIRTQTPPALMLGGSYQLISYEFDEGRVLGLDFGASVGRTFVRDGKFFPVTAFRLKVVKDRDMTVFAGLSTSPYSVEGDLVWGLVYGVGTKF